MANEEVLQLQTALENTDAQPDENFGTEEASVEDLPKVKDEIDEILDAVPDVKPAAEDYGAAFIERHLGAAKVLINGLGGNAIKRVFLNVMAGEFSRREYNPVTDQERKLAYHFNECISLRAKMVFTQEFEKLTDAFQKEQDDLKKIDELTQKELTPEAKQMLAESSDKVEIQVD